MILSKGIWSKHQIPHNQSFPAYIVFSEIWRDLHRHIIFLSPHYGLFSAFLYGAVSKRNPLRATVQSFSFGQLTLKSGRQTHIGDWNLEPPSLLLKTPSCLEVYRHVALWSELLLYSHGLGQRDPAQLFAELRSLLSSMLHFDAAAYCQLASLRFFWQFLLLEGFRPGLNHCHSCAQDFHLQEKNRGQNQGQNIFFSAHSELFCERCAQRFESLQERSGGNLLCSEELELLRWAEQDLSSFVRQNEFFFGLQAAHYSKVAHKILATLQNSLELLLGRKLRAGRYNRINSTK